MDKQGLKRFLWPTMAIAMLVVVGFLLLRYNRAQNAYKLAQASLADCRKLCNDIQLLRARPTQASKKANTQASLSKMLEETAHSFGIPTEKIIRISPSRPQRIPETDYEEQPTLVEIREVRLEQLAQLLVKVEHEQLSLKTLRISVPRQQTNSDEEIWNVEATISQLIFRPASR